MRNNIEDKPAAPIAYWMYCEIKDLKTLADAKKRLRAIETEQRKITRLLKRAANLIDDCIG